MKKNVIYLLTFLLFFMAGCQKNATEFVIEEAVIVENVGKNIGTPLSGSIYAYSIKVLVDNADNTIRFSYEGPQANNFSWSGEDVSGPPSTSPLNPPTSYLEFNTSSESIEIPYSGQNEAIFHVVFSAKIGFYPISTAFLLRVTPILNSDTYDLELILSDGMSLEMIGDDGGGLSTAAVITGG